MLLPATVAAAVLLSLASAGGAEAAFKLPPLPFEPNATEPVIDKQTNIFHHDKHHAAYIKKLNAALENYTDLQQVPLSELIKRVGTGSLPGAVETDVRNQGGGAWNHDLWWNILAPPGSPDADPKMSISANLSKAVDKSFGSYDEMLKKLQGAANKHFGSGWAWLIVTGNGSLEVVDTLNQDNPLSKLPKTTQGIPILGIDVWEHSFYLKYGPDKASFVDAWPKVVNWKRVSENFEYAREGKVGSIIGKEYDQPFKS